FAVETECGSLAAFSARTSPGGSERECQSPREPVRPKRATARGAPAGSPSQAPHPIRAASGRGFVEAAGRQAEGAPDGNRPYARMSTYQGNEVYGLWRSQ